MDFNAGQKNTAAQGVPPAQPAPRFANNSNGMGGVNMNTNNNNKWIIAVVVIIAVIVIAALSAWGLKQMASAQSLVKDDKYQAVFLTNGQVYFAKLDKANNDYVELTDIYYLQVQQTVQPDQAAEQEDDPQVSLVKLGDELHGPEDLMVINRDHVLFWENLKDDGRVTEAIREHKNQ